MNGRRKLCVCTITILIGLALVNIRVSALQPPLIYVSPPTYTATALGEFTIDVDVANVSDLRVAEFWLGYNTTILDAKNVTQGPFMNIGYNVFQAEINDALGYIHVTISILGGSPAVGSGTLATITLNATYYGSVSCVLDLHDTGLGDSSAEPIIHEVADGHYKFIILTLTVATSKQSYWVEESINIYGHLIQDSSPVDGLVALQVKDPSHKTIIFRTLQTGTNSHVGNVTILETYPCDSWGNPQNSFSRGTLVYFNVTVKNNDIIERTVMITVNAYDGNTVPFGVAAAKFSMPPNTTAVSLPSIPVPSWVSIGTGSVYASVFTGDPALGGFAYCPEKSASYEIVGGTLGMKGLSSHSIVEGITTGAGTYSLTFKLLSGNEGSGDRQSRIGNYNVYVSSSYQKQHDEEQTTFRVKVPGDVDGDGDVDIYDLTKLAKSWQKRIGDPQYNPNADFNNDGIVNIYDLTTLAKSWFIW